VVPGWGQLPPGPIFGGTHGAVAEDKAGRIYVSMQSTTGILVYDRQGALLRTIAHEYPEVHSMFHAEESGEEYFYTTTLNAEHC
jgi:peptidylamidoglycolate lyase